MQNMAEMEKMKYEEALGRLEKIGGSDRGPADGGGGYPREGEGGGGTADVLP